MSQGGGSVLRVDAFVTLDCRLDFRFRGRNIVLSSR